MPKTLRNLILLLIFMHVDGCLRIVFSRWLDPQVVLFVTVVLLGTRSIVSILSLGVEIRGTEMGVDR